MSEAEFPSEPAQTPSTERVEGGAPVPTAVPSVVEIGGREAGPDPTRYGDWEKNGRCIDF